MLRKNKKIFATALFAIIAINLISVFFILAPLASVSAVEFTPQVTIGDFEKGKAVTVGDDTSMIGAYIKSIYEYAIGIVGIVAAVVLMFGGLLYLTAGGSADKISNAKSWIGASLTGLVLVLSSYLLLSMINPSLVNFKIQDVKRVDVVPSSGCCLPFSGASGYETTSDKCDGVGKFLVSYKAVNGECTSKTPDTTSATKTCWCASFPGSLVCYLNKPSSNYNNMYSLTTVSKNTPCGANQSTENNTDPFCSDPANDGKICGEVNEFKSLVCNNGECEETCFMEYNVCTGTDCCPGFVCDGDNYCTKEIIVEADYCYHGSLKSTYEMTEVECITKAGCWGAPCVDDSDVNGCCWFYYGAVGQQCNTATMQACAAYSGENPGDNVWFVEGTCMSLSDCI